MISDDRAGMEEEEEEEEDRVSKLPKHLKHSILRRLPLHIALRTAILSRTWRNIWQLYPQLVFDDTFFSHLVHEKHQAPHQCEATVHSIILHRTSPILKFHLYLPPYLEHINDDNSYNTSSPFVHACFNSISDKGVRSLKLINSEQNPYYEISSSLFSCSGLRHLYLSNWKLKPPHNFGGFPNLIRVQLVNISIMGDMSFGTALKEISLIRCAGVQHLPSQFKENNTLVKLLISGISEEILEWQWFEYCQNLQVFNLSLIPNLRSIRRMNLNKLLSNMPNISSLCLSGPSLVLLEPSLATVNSLTSRMEKLKFLGLFDLAIDNFCQVSNAICLLRSLPNLRHVLILQGSEVKSRRRVEVALEELLGSPHPAAEDVMRINLHKLHILEIDGVMGSKVELLFVQLLCRSSPWLKKLIVRQHPKVTDDPEKEDKLVRNFLSYLHRKCGIRWIYWS